VLEAARLALCAAGVLARESRMPPFTARMSGDLVILAYPDGDAFYMVKVGLRSDFQREAKGLRLGHQAFPESVPQVLDVSVQRSFPALVTTGIAFEPLGAPAMRDAIPWLANELRRYFAVSTRAFHCDEPRSHASRIREAFAASWARSLDADCERYLDEVSADADSLPAVSQHGDFYLENLGVRGQRLVILDWEDFGRECLPGFDLAQLLLSLNAFDVGRMHEHVRPGGQHAWLLAAGCEGAGLSTALFMRLVPAYLALLGSMKSQLGYGDAFTSRTLCALHTALSMTVLPKAGAVR
jgi:hypothetical protein